MPDFNFAHPWVLWLIVPLVVALPWRWFGTPAAVAVSSTKHFTTTERSNFFAPRHLLLVLECLAAVAFIIALARPQSDIEILPITEEGTDIMLVLDYSNSMDAFDPPPEMSKQEILQAIRERKIKDRLGVARDQIVRFVKRRSGDRIGLVIFGVKSYAAVPPTNDHDYLIAYVNQLTNSLLDQSERGTNIATGISTGINSLKDYRETKRTMVLITDGDHTVPDSVFTPTTAAEAAAKEDITIHTVGIGSDKPFLLSKLKAIGAPIRFDTRNLERIAAITNGRFFRAKDNQGFEEVMDTIDSLETTKTSKNAIVYERDLYQNFLIAGIAFLAIAFLLRHSLLREIS